MKRYINWIKDLFTIESGEMINSRRLLRFFFFTAVVFSLIFGISFLILMRGSRSVQLPNLNNEDVLQAVKTLQKLRLRPYIRETYNRGYSRYRVIDQKPESGTIVKAGRVVVLKVSLGKKVSLMPDYVGETFEQAQSDIVSLFTAFEKAPELVKVLRYSTNVERGLIVEQRPVAGERFDLSQDIVFVVSRGIVSNTITTGFYIWKNYKDVEAQLSEAGIDVKVRFKSTDRDDKIGKIFSQNVKKGTELNNGESIEFVVGVKSTETSELSDREIWRVFSLQVPPGGDGSGLRKLEIKVNDILGTEVRFSEKVRVDSFADVPYRTHGRAEIEVYLDGDLYSTHTVE